MDGDPYSDDYADSDGYADPHTDVYGYSDRNANIGWNGYTDLNAYID
jgi:hypothetical protein